MVQQVKVGNSKALYFFFFPDGKGPVEGQKLHDVNGWSWGNGELQAFIWQEGMRSNAQNG